MRRRIGNGRRAVVLLVALSLLGAGAETAQAAVTSCPYVCSWDGGKRPQDVIRSVRAGLLDGRPSLSGASARTWVERTNVALGWALEGQRWSSDGSLRPTGPGAGGLVGLRVAAGRLSWGDEAVAAATGAEVRALVAAMSWLVEARLSAVESAGGDPAVVWRARYDLTSGDSVFATRPMQASYRYLQAWNRLLRLPPLDANSPPPETLPDESDVPGGAAGGGGGTGGGGTGGSGGTEGEEAVGIAISALPSTGRVDRRLPLRYRVRANRETRVEVWILDGKAIVRRATTSFADRSGRAATMRLRPLRTAGKLKFCVRAVDRADRRTAASCAALEIRFVVQAAVSRGVAGRVVLLRYRIASQHSASAVIAIMAGDQRIKTLTTSRSAGAGVRTFRWKSHASLGGKTLSFCVVATTAAGERSVRSCARVRLARPPS